MRVLLSSKRVSAYLLDLNVGLGGGRSSPSRRPPKACFLIGLEQFSQTTSYSYALPDLKPKTGQVRYVVCSLGPKAPK